MLDRNSASIYLFPWTFAADPINEKYAALDHKLDLADGKGGVGPKLPAIKIVEHTSKRTDCCLISVMNIHTVFVGNVETGRIRA